MFTPLKLGIMSKREELLKDRSRNNRPKMESLVLSPKSANQDLLIVSDSPRNGIFNESVWNYLVGTSDVICLDRPFLSLKER